MIKDTLAKIESTIAHVGTLDTKNKAELITLLNKLKSEIGGLPASPREKMMENLFNLNRLKNFFKKIEELAHRIDDLEKNKENG